MEKSLGEQRVRVDFNVSNSTVVDVIKTDTAQLINLVEELIDDGANPPHPEKTRLCKLAQTAYEEAAMWAVKAATFTI